MVLKCTVPLAHPVILIRRLIAPRLKVGRVGASQSKLCLHTVIVDLPPRKRPVPAAPKENVAAVGLPARSVSIAEKLKLRVPKPGALVPVTPPSKTLVSRL